MRINVDYYYPSRQPILISVSLVQNVQIEPCVHALARSSSGETAAAAHESVEYAEADEVRVPVAAALEAEHEMGQVREWRRTQRHRAQIFLCLKQSCHIMPGKVFGNGDISYLNSVRHKIAWKIVFMENS